MSLLTISLIESKKIFFSTIWNINYIKMDQVDWPIVTADHYFHSCRSSVPIFLIYWRDPSAVGLAAGIIYDTCFEYILI